MVFGLLGQSLLYFLFAVGLGAGIGEQLGKKLGKSPRKYAGIGAGIGLAALLTVALVSWNQNRAAPTPAPAPAATLAPALMAPPSTSTTTAHAPAFGVSPSGGDDWADETATFAADRTVSNRDKAALVAPARPRRGGISSAVAQ